MRNQVLEIVSVLEQEGIPVFMVGGCVRDMHLGRNPKDFDLASPMTSDEILKRLSNYEVKLISASQAYPVVHFKGLELASFRSDGLHRNDLTGIRQGATIDEDAARRDFTMNALYQKPSGEILDPTGQGLEDIQERVIRFVGDPWSRIQEDPLRVVRAFRFASQLSFKIEALSLQACRDAIQQIKMR